MSAYDAMPVCVLILLLFDEAVGDAVGLTQCVDKTSDWKDQPISKNVM